MALVSADDGTAGLMPSHDRVDDGRLQHVLAAEGRRKRRRVTQQRRRRADDVERRAGDGADTSHAIVRHHFDAVVAALERGQGHSHGREDWVALRGIEISRQRRAVEDLRRERADLFVAGRGPPLQAEADGDVRLPVRPRARVDHLYHEGKTLVGRQRLIAGGYDFGAADGVGMGRLLVWRDRHLAERHVVGNDHAAQREGRGRRRQLEAPLEHACRRRRIFRRRIGPSNQQVVVAGAGREAAPEHRQPASIGREGGMQIEVLEGQHGVGRARRFLPFETGLALAILFGLAFARALALHFQQLKVLRRDSAARRARHVSGVRSRSGAEHRHVADCESALSLQRRVVAPGEPLRDHRTLGHELSRSRSSGEPYVDDALLVDGDSLWSQQRERHVVRAVRSAQHVKGPVDGWCVGGSRGLVDGGDNRLHGTALTAREFRRLLSVGRQGGGQAQKRGDSDDGDASHLTYLVITG